MRPSSSREDVLPPALFDSHVHLDDPAFAKDIATVLERAKQAGVHQVFVPGVNLSAVSSTALEEPNLLWPALASAAREAGVSLFQGVGQHPLIFQSGPRQDADAVTPEAIARCIQDQGAVAVGECGLDKNIPEKSAQERLFRMHIRAARDGKCPLVLHVYGAHERAQGILREEKAGEIGGVVHGYSGSAQEVRGYLNLGFAWVLAGRSPTQTPEKHPRPWLRPPSTTSFLKRTPPSRPPIPTAAPATNLATSRPSSNGGRHFGPNARHPGRDDHRQRTASLRPSSLGTPRAPSACYTSAPCQPQPHPLTVGLTAAHVSWETPPWDAWAMRR